MPTLAIEEDTYRQLSKLQEEMEGRSKSVSYDRIIMKLIDYWEKGKRNSLSTTPTTTVTTTTATTKTLDTSSPPRGTIDPRLYRREDKV